MTRAFVSRGLRIELVNAVMRGELPLETAATTAGISLRQLLSWLREHGGPAEPSLDDLRMSEQERRLQALRRRVHLLECRLAAARLERAQLLRHLASTTVPISSPKHPPHSGTDAPIAMGMLPPSNWADPATSSFL